MPTNHFLNRRSPFKRVKECNFVSVTTSDDCCQRAFAGSVFDPYFPTDFLINAWNNGVFSNSVFSIDRVRPLESFDPVCEETHTRGHNGRHYIYGQIMCTFKCRDIRPSPELIDWPQFVKIKDKDMLAQVVRATKVQTRDVPDFAIFCPAGWIADIETIESQWAAAVPREREGIVCRHPDDRPSKRRKTDSECLNADTSPLEADPDFTIPNDLVWTMNDHLRVQVEYQPRYDGYSA